MRAALILLAACSSAAPHHTASCPSPDSLLADSARAYREGHLFLARDRVNAADKQCSTTATRAAIAAIDAELAVPKDTKPAPLADASYARLTGDAEAAAALLRPLDKYLDARSLAELGRAELAANHPAAAQRALERALARATDGKWEWPEINRSRISQLLWTRGGERIVTSDTEGHVVVWDASSLRQLRKIDLKAYSRQLAISPDGHFLASVYNEPWLVRVFDLDTGEKVNDFELLQGPIAFLPSNHLLIGKKDEFVEYDVETLKDVEHYSTPNTVENILVLPDKILTTASGKISYWDPKTHEVVHDEILPANIGEIHVAATGRVAATIDGAIVFRDPDGSKLPQLTGRYYQLALRDDGKQLAAVNYNDATLQIFDVETGKPLRTIPAQRTTDVLAYHPRGGLLIGAGWDGVEMWNADAGKHIAMLGPGTSAATTLAFDTTGDTLAVGTGSQVALWSMKTGDVATRTVRPGETVTHLDFNADGDLAASSDNPAPANANLNSTVVVWDKTGHKKWWSEQSRLNWLGWRPHSKTLATGGLSLTSDGNRWAFMLWSEDGKTSRTVETDVIRGYHWSPDGDTLIGSTNAELIVQPLGGGKPTKIDARTWTIAVDPSGKRVAASVDNGNVAIWDLAQRRPQRVLFDEHGSLSDMGWSHDGRYLVTAAFDTATVWDVATGARVATLPGATTIWAVAVRPDGKVVATSHSDGRVVLWSLATAKPIATLNAPTEHVAFVTSPDGAIDGTLPDDYLAWRAGDIVLPGRAAYDRQHQPGLLAIQLAKVSGGTPTAEAAPTLPTCFAKKTERDTRQLRSSTITADGKAAHVCYDVVTYLRDNQQRLPVTCFDVDLASGKYTPKAPTPREALGLPAEEPPRVEHGEDGLVRVCTNDSCKSLRVRGKAEQQRYVASDDGKLLAATIQLDSGREAVLVYEVATGTRLSQFIAQRDGSEFSFLDDSLFLTPHGRLFNVRRGQFVGRPAVKSPTFFPTRVSEDVWAFGDWETTNVAIQNVRTGKLVDKVRLPKSACSNDPNADYVQCNNVTLLAAGSRFVVLPSLRPGDVMVVDQRGKLLGDHHLPMCQ